MKRLLNIVRGVPVSGWLMLSELAIAVGSVIAIAVGLWWLSPPWCLVLTGALVLALTILGQATRRGGDDKSVPE